MKSLKYFIILIALTLVGCDASNRVGSEDTTAPKSYFDNQSKTVTINGLNFHYVEQGEGQVVILLHGFPNYSEFWQPLITPLSKNYHVVAPDNRGYGFTDKPENISDYKLEKLVEDVRQLILKLAPNKKVVLIGHDWGGALAWSTSQQYPELVEKVVVINAVPTNTFLNVMSTSPAQQEASSYFSRLTGWPAKVMFWVKGPELLWGRRDYLIEQEHVTPAFKEAYLSAWRQPGAAQAAVNWYRANIPEDFSNMTEADYWPGKHAKITVPAMMIWSTGDRTLSEDAVMALPDYVNDLTLKKIDTTSHSPFLDHTDTVLEYINEFIKD